MGESEGWCGANFIVLVLKPFTAGEDAVILWATRQDDSELVDILHLSDGRDYIVLQRKHSSQGYREAIREQEAFAMRLIIVAQRNMTHDTQTRNT